MTQTPAVAAISRVLEVPGAHLHYEVRGQGPLIALVGAPMDAHSFVPLADLLATGYTVLTADPRGINRSAADDPEQDSTPQMRADDLSRLLSHLTSDPATVLGSSGGAVTALALVQAHPDQVDTVIAHEPPLIELLDDRSQLRTGTEDMIATHIAGDVTGAWTKFFRQANMILPDGVAEAIFGGHRTRQEVADERFWFVHEFRASTYWRPNLRTLRSVDTRIVVGIGEESTTQLCDRTSRALAVALGTEPTMFPGGHTGFVEQPEQFAARLRAVLP